MVKLQECADLAASCVFIFSKITGPLRVQVWSVAADLLEKSQRSAAWNAEKKYRQSEAERRSKILEKRGVHFRPCTTVGRDAAKVLRRVTRQKRSFARAYRLHKIAETNAASRAKDFRKEKGAGYVSLRQHPKPFHLLRHKIRHGMKATTLGQGSSVGAVEQNQNSREDEQPDAKAKSLQQRRELWKKYQKAARARKNKDNRKSKKRQAVAKPVKGTRPTAAERKRKSRENKKKSQAQGAAEEAEGNKSEQLKQPPDKKKKAKAAAAAESKQGNKVPDKNKKKRAAAAAKSLSMKKPPDKKQNTRAATALTKPASTTAKRKGVKK